MIKVSVVVPAYNVEKYLGKCLDSLVEQTLKDIEIIVVNDGSTDGTKNILEEYAKKYPKKIKAFNIKNSGPGGSRNFGISKASGEYIGFIDSDDYADTDMFEKLYKKASSKNFDIAVCDVTCVNGETQSVISSLYENDLFNKQEIKNHMLRFYPVVWNKIYKREIFKHLKFKKDVWYEDVDFLYKLIPYLNNIGVIKEPLINYVQREGAITKTFDTRAYYYIENWNNLIDFYKQNNFYDEYKIEVEYCYLRYICNTFSKTLAKTGNLKMFFEGISIAKRNIKDNFPKYRHNKFLYKPSSILMFLNNLYFIFYGKILAYFLFVAVNKKIK